MDCSSLPGSSVRGIFQARVLERVAIPSPGDLPSPWIEPGSPALQTDALPSEPCLSHSEWLTFILQLKVFLSDVLGEPELHVVC